MASNAESSPWGAIPAAKMAQAWEKVVPNSAERILDEALKNVARERRLAWAQVALQGLTLLLVGGSVASFVWLAKYYVDHGAPTQGATIVCTGLVALVGALLGRKVVADRKSVESSDKTNDDSPSADNDSQAVEAGADPPP